MTGIKHLRFNVVTSTNDEAKKVCDKYRRALITARRQTNGRGSGGRAFYSPADTGLYMSYILDIPPQDALKIPLTPLCAVAVCRALSRFGVKNIGVKWVNDLYLDGKKVCGILVEGCNNKVICGIGVNLTTEYFPDGICAGSVSLKISPEKLSKRIVFEINRALKRRDFKEEYLSRSVLTGKTLSFTENGETKKALAEGFDEDLRLILKTDGEIRKINSGEIHITGF